MNGSAAARTARQVALYLVPVTISNLVPLVTLPIVTRVVPVAEYGAWVLASAYGVCAASLCNLGLPLIIERNLIERQQSDAQGRLVFTTVAIVGGLLGVIVLATWVWSARLGAWLFDRPDLGILLVATTVASGLVSLKAYHLLYFRAHGDAASHVRYSLDESLAAALLSLALLFTTNLGVLALAAGQLVACLVTFVAASRRVASRLPLGFDLDTFLSAVKQAAPLGARVVLGVVSKNLDKLFLSQLNSIAGVAAYGVGQRIAYVVFAATTALDNVFIPAVYRRMFGHEPGGGRGIGEYLTPFWYMTVGVALAVALFADDVVAVLLPADYRFAAVTIHLLSIYYAIQFFGKQPQLLYANKTIVNSVMSAINIVVAGVLQYALISTYGLVGAPVATLLSGIVAVTTFTVVGQRYYRIHWQWGRMVGLLAYLVLAVVTTAWLAAVGVSPLVRLLSDGVLLVTYVAGGLLLNIVPIRNLSALLGREAVPSSATL